MFLSFFAVLVLLYLPAFFLLLYGSDLLFWSYLLLFKLYVLLVESIGLIFEGLPGSILDDP